MDLPATVTVLAHAGHWAMSLIYVAPVLAVVGFIVRQNRQDRRHGGTGAPSDRPTGEPMRLPGDAS